MEVLALEDSSLAGDDTLLAEVRRELEIEVCCFFITVLAHICQCCCYK